MYNNKQKTGNLFSREHFINGSAAFTLLEILVAMFIFSIIATTVFGSYRAVFGKAGLIEKDMQIGEMAQNCLNRITLDLTAIHVAPAQTYTAPGLDSGPDPFRFTGEVVGSSAGDFPRIRFTSSEHISFGPVRREGIAEIVYYVAATDNDHNSLMRSDRLSYDEPFEENPADPVLCDSVTALTATFYDQEGDTHDRWDSDSEEFDNGTPRAVGIEIAVGNEASLRRYKTTVSLPVYRDGTNP